MQLVDTHAHIYLPEFDADRPDIIARASRVGISAILMPAIDSGTHTSMLDTERNFPLCKAMMGLHPCSVRENYAAELAVVEDYFSKRDFVAVGEIGLDFYWDKTFTSQQYAAFHRQIQLAIQKGLPIVIHSREAVDECIEVVRQYPGLRGVFHCFSGTVDQAEAIRGLGFYLGIGGVISFKNAGLDKVMERTGLEGVLLETDAPYLAPVPFRGKRNEPSYLEYVLEKLAGIKGCSPGELAKITTDHAFQLFNLA
jgi:TatD DNase family protein